MSPVLPILRGDNKVALSCKLRDGLSVTEVPRCKGKQKSRKSKTFGCFFEVRGARYEVRGTRCEVREYLSSFRVD